MSGIRQVPRCPHGVATNNRCAVCEPLARPQGTASGPPSITRVPHCERCGTGNIEDGARFCYVCRPIVEARNPATVTSVIRDGKPPAPEGL